jgi:hypothetical protein
MLAGFDLAVGQQVPLAQLKTLLPVGAEIIEIADLNIVAGKPRIMTLWMLNPERNLDDRWNQNQAGGYCTDIVRGDFGKFWKGPTRLSLVDSGDARIVNTIEVRDDCGGCRAPADSFTVPLCVLNRQSPLGKPTPELLGRPNLDLRDLTGQRLNAEFALFTFEAFGLVSTGVFGYEPKFDRVVQYPVEILGSKKPVTVLWTEEVFAREPVRPGYWKFTWEPGHGDPATHQEEVSFDRRRLLFRQKTRVSKPNRSPSP